MLAHPDVDRRQLFDLAARWLTGRDPLALAKDVPAATALRLVLDDLIDGPRRQQRTPVAFMAILSAALTPRPTLATRRRRGRIAARRSGGVPRGAIQLALNLSDPLVLAPYTLLQTPNLTVHPQQHRDHDLTALVIDRLSLSPIHIDTFDATRLCPPTN
jgi:hypothetical protein